jgi:hypothetical protein
MKNKRNLLEGDFSALSQWLGTDLDYSKIQFIGRGSLMI